MEIKQNQEKDIEGIIFNILDGEKVIARSRLYLLKNDLHNEPFGFVEDVWVDENYRKQGLGSKLYEEMIKVAEEKGCYKIIACSRFSRDGVHAFIEKNGFVKHGYEFKMEFDKTK